MRFGLTPGMFMRTWGVLRSASRRCLSTTEESDCGIEGTWTNGLGSKVTFRCNNGQLNGTYKSAVGEAESYYLLSGRYILEPESRVVLLGWVVAWKNRIGGDSHSTTSWSGIYYPDQKVMRTQWLLTDYNEDQEPPQKYWETTIVNHDEFTKDI